ncbi:MAG: hypothetical protein KGN76_13935 [Acidobacteriota bacterium]|nr:hypothetical protein [Acidobacteriota bacterium]
MGGRRLACGCFSGLYNAGQEFLETLDACDPDCPDRHQPGLVLDRHVAPAGTPGRRRPGARAIRGRFMLHASSSAARRASSSR